jgi:disulfide bond formation protein DsbB
MALPFLLLLVLLLLLLLLSPLLLVLLLVLLWAWSRGSLKSGSHTVGAPSG